MIKRLAKECLGTGLLALTMGLCLLLAVPGFAIALIYAVLLAALLFAFGPGAHFNPAVTLGFGVAGRFSFAELVPIVSAQIIGASVGTGVIFLIVGAQSLVAPLYTMPTLFDLVVGLVAMWIAISLVILANHKRVALRNRPLMVGMVFFAVISLTLPFANFAFNPALLTGFGLMADPGIKSQLWLLWLASLSGAALGGLSGNYLSAKID